MAQKTYDERLGELVRRQEQLKAQEREMRKKHAEEERRKRTRRLIELGGIVESVLGRDTTEEDKMRLLNFLKRQEANGRFFTKAMNAGRGESGEAEAVNES